MLTSRIVRGLLKPLLYVAGISVGVSVYESLLHAGVVKEWLEHMAVVVIDGSGGEGSLPSSLGAVLAKYEPQDITISPMGPFSISTFALSLLLVFRTNSSYDRYVCLLFKKRLFCRNVDAMYWQHVVLQRRYLP